MKLGVETEEAKVELVPDRIYTVAELLDLQDQAVASTGKTFLQRIAFEQQNKLSNTQLASEKVWGNPEMLYLI